MDYLALYCALFMKFNGEKTVYAAFHLLRGKRSGQTIQDVNYYQLKPYFGLLPKLSKTEFDEIIEELKKNNYIRIEDQSILKVTEKGQRKVANSKPFLFDGWNYRGNEQIFFARLSLIVQTVSHFKERVSHFMPIQRELNIQQFAKAFLRYYPISDLKFSIQLKNEVKEALLESGMSEEQKVIFTHRLVGHELTGWTWNQLGIQLEMVPYNVKLSFIESLHMLLNTINRSSQLPLLTKIAYKIKVENPLSVSTNQTKTLFDQGYEIEEIATIRQLKVSTIEDHIVEIALNNEGFPFEKFVSIDHIIAIQQLAKNLNTKRLRVLKESFPALSYFQIRLILSVSLKGDEEQ